MSSNEDDTNRGDGRQYLAENFRPIDMVARTFKPTPGPGKPDPMAKPSTPIGPSIAGSPSGGAPSDQGGGNPASGTDKQEK